MPPPDTIAARRNEPTQKRPPTRRGRKAFTSATAALRNLWRRLTSMHTALVLLFLLTIAALPGALLPQWSTSRENTSKYIADHPGIGP